MMGRLTDEPIRSVTISGKIKVQFRIAVPKKFKKDGQTADFFNCEAWEQDAERIHQYFFKGDSILVKGRVENDNYTTRDGQKVYSVIFKVEEWHFGPKKRSAGGLNDNQERI